MTDEKTCGVCGNETARVRRVPMPGESSLADTAPPVVGERYCTNAECGSHGESALSDSV